MRTSPWSHLPYLLHSPRLLLPLATVLLLTVVGATAGCAAETTTTTLPPTTTSVSVAEATTTSSSTTTTMLTTTTTEATTTTTEATTTTTTIPPDPKGWKRFEAEGISVTLPKNFKGGDPAGSEVKAQVRTMVDGRSWLKELQEGFDDGDIDWLLAMFGSSSKTRWIPMVFAMRVELPPFVTFYDFVDEMAYSPVEGATVETVEESDTRAVYLLDEPKDGSDPAGSRYLVFIGVGDYVYWVDYSGTKVAFAQFEEDYRMSIERIIITDQTDEDGSSTGTTSDGTTTTLSGPVA